MAKARVKKKVKKKTKKKTALTKQDMSILYPWLSLQQQKTLSRGGYFDSEGLIHRADGCIRCTGVVTATGRRCRNFALPGETTCMCHGGRLSRNKRQKAGSIYSKFIQDKKISAVYESIVNDDELRGMQEELGMLRALLAKVIGDEAGDVDSKSLKNIATVVGEVRLLISDCTKTEIRLGQLIDIGKITLIVKQLAAIIQKHIKDEDVIRKIAVEFDNVIWPGTGASTPQPERKRPVRGVSSTTY